MRLSPRKSAEAFTIIELLAAMAVFLMLTVLILQIVSAAARSTDSGNRSLDSTKSARISLDTLAADLANSVTSSGCTIIAGVDTTGLTTSLTFLCASRPDTTVSSMNALPRFAGVYFGTGLRDGVPMLFRGFKSVDWDTNLPEALVSVYDDSEGNLDPERVDSLGESVFRMAVAYLKTDNTIVYTAVSNGLEYADYKPEPSKASGIPLDLSEIKAIIVAVASLDKKSQKLMLSTNANGMKDLSDRFELPVNSQNKSPLDVWNTVNLNSLPPPVVQNVRYFQRTIYLQ